MSSSRSSRRRKNRPRKRPARLQWHVETFGGTTISPKSSGVYRGNAFRITKPFSIAEVEFELDFGSASIPICADVNFIVYRNDGTTSVPQWTVLFQTPELQLVGVGRKFYSSGQIKPPKIEAGIDYAFGLAWSSVDIRYFRGTESYPRDFGYGQVLGSIGTSNPKGTATDMPMVVSSFPFSGGAYSMRLRIGSKEIDKAQSTTEETLPPFMFAPIGVGGTPGAWPR